MRKLSQFNKDYAEMELLAKTINARLKYILETTISFEPKPDSQPVNEFIKLISEPLSIRLSKAIDTYIKNATVYGTLITVDMY